MVTTIGMIMNMAFRRKNWSFVRRIVGHFPTLNTILNDLGHKPRAEEWMEVGHVVTSIGIIMNKKRGGWKVDQEEQLRYLTYHDRQAHRLGHIMDRAARIAAANTSGDGICQ